MTREQFIANVRIEQEGLRRFLLVLCEGNSQFADDIAQEALVKAYIASDGYVPRFKFSSWLFKIAYNCFIDSIRKRSLLTVKEEEAKDTEAEESADDSFHYQELYDAIEGLSPGEKAAILLFYLEDRSVKEISTILNIPQGTVRSQLSRGREHLRQLIKQ